MYPCSGKEDPTTKPTLLDIPGNQTQTPDRARHCVKEHDFLPASSDSHHYDSSARLSQPLDKTSPAIATSFLTCLELSNTMPGQTGETLPLQAYL
ncbi:MAG: hypothetical protein E6I59_17335 [Chloroflexi bacterium]|nr:MAG: hypothetical protein E6I59_17335 [Chloroflexota bacterium]